MRSRITRFGLLLVTGFLALTSEFGVHAQGNPPLRFTFFDLDQGEATLVETPGGERSLVGAGGPGEGPALLRKLKSRGIREIDTLLITTWSDAQLGGAIDVLKGIRVKQLFHNSLFAPSKRANAVYSFAQQREKEHKLQMGSPAPGQSITVFYSPPCQWTIVAPTGPMLTRFAGDPDCSSVVEYSYEKISLLDLGETTRVHQKAMWETSRARPAGDVVVVGRNGEEKALLPSLLKPLKTRVAIIPVSRKTGRKPAPELLSTLRKAGVKVYRTDLQGDLVVTTNGRTVGVRTSR